MATTVLDSENGNGSPIEKAMANDFVFSENMRQDFLSASRREMWRVQRIQFAQGENNGSISKNLLREITQRRAGSITIGADGRLVQFTAPVDTTTVPNSIRKKMRKGNPIVKAALAARKAPIMRAFDVWRIESSVPRVQQFIRAALEPILKRLVQTSLLSLDFGHAPHEKIFTKRDLELPAIGEDKPSTIKGAFVLKKLKELEPDKVVYFVHSSTAIDADGNGHSAGDFAGFKHNNRDDEFVPADKAFVVTNEKEFGIITGNSVLDAAYTPYYWWTASTLFMNRYLERRGTPFIKARAPGRILTKDGETKAAAEIIGDQLESLYDGGVVALPSERDEKGNPLWDIEFLEDQGRGDQFVMWIDQCAIYMLLGICIPDSVLMTPRREGSRALAEVRKDLFDEISSLTVETVEGHINEFIIPQLIDLNRNLLGIAPDAQLPTARIRAQVRPTDRQDMLMRLLEALVKAKDSPAAARTFSLLSIMEILQEMGAPISPDLFQGVSEKEMEEKFPLLPPEPVETPSSA